MSACRIARCQTIDAVGYKKYPDRVPEIIAHQHRKVLARGGKFQIMERPRAFHPFVVIEFPTMDDAIRCLNSEECIGAAAFHHGAVENFMVYGGDATVR